jgi:DNA-binding HxlR family transcriptional regulator
LAQALSAPVAITSVRNGCRIAGKALGPNGTERSGSIHVEQDALELSSIDRAKIVSSAQAALCLIRGKWKVQILATMLDGPVRLGQLQRLIPRASKKVLVQQLHELEMDGIIVRTDFSGKIKHVEYTISVPLGKALVNLLTLLSDWGLRYAPAMAVPGRTRVGAAAVLPMSAKSKITVQMEDQADAGSCSAELRARPLISAKRHD